jgi:uncharacterized membrane protein
MRVISASHVCFACVMMALGILGFVYGDFALVWQAVPAWVPERTILAYACAALMLTGGAALLWRRTAGLASSVLLVYLLLWLVLLRVTKVVMAPLTELPWSGCGENAVLLAGGWILFAALAKSEDKDRLNFAKGERGTRAAGLLYGFALVPCGLAHLVYPQETAALVPAWLPWHLGWAYLTGAAYIVAGAAIVFGVCARQAATLSAAMMATFTLLVWAPGVLHAPRDRFQWTALVISSALTAGAWLVADSYRRAAWNDAHA